LEKKGFKVTKEAFGIKTAFMAEFSQGEGKRVGVCSEYDALPGLGQGCGHNLIAISGLATAIAIKTVLESGKANGKVVLFGTPSEGNYSLQFLLRNSQSNSKHRKYHW
jgi:metal-dependent amidase/aminoacylase/carboxypeptidase family protein